MRISDTGSSFEFVFGCALVGCGLGGCVLAGCMLAGLVLAGLVLGPRKKSKIRLNRLSVIFASLRVVTLRSDQKAWQARSALPSRRLIAPLVHGSAARVAAERSDA